jgi:nitrate reductase NapAB chaperone NapD
LTTAATAVSAAATAVVTVTVAVSTVDIAEAKASGKLIVAVEVSEAGEIATCSGVTGSSAYATACVTYK